MKKILCIGMLWSLSILSNGGSLSISCKNGQFAVQKNGKVVIVARHDLDKALRTMTPEQLKASLSAGCHIRAHAMHDGSYRLEHSVPGLGGGPIIGCITAIISYTATGVAAVGTMAAVSVIKGIPEGLVAGAAVGAAGAAASGAATTAAFAAPTP